jgi:hypothetical protein
VSFSIKLFTIKGILVFMNNLYHKVAVASVCTTLGFALGVNKEAKAATFTLVPTHSFVAIDWGSPNSSSLDGLGDAYYPASNPSAEIGLGSFEARASYEFNIGNLSLATNTFIRQAIVEARINSRITNFPNFLSIFGYVGNEMYDISDFEAGVFLNSVDVSSSSAGDILRFDVTPFVNQLVSSNHAFAGFTIRASNFGGVVLNAYDNNSSLVIEAEPVPEPTTIFGSALALSLGGWLKRKNSSQNKS